jgi:hypothetical protein
MAAGRRRPPTLESLFVATFALLGLRWGLRPLGDNSLFVHLRTGIDLVSRSAIPKADVYSFTAHGHPWVVQSWLASAIYGALHRFGGFEAVRLLHGLLYGLLALLIARLSRTGSPLHTALCATLAIGLGLVYWSPRPLAFGLLCLALTITLTTPPKLSHPRDKPPPGGAPKTAATSARPKTGPPPWLLVPVVWLWVNTHGSFVLGLAWLVLVAVGQRLDGQRRPAILPWLGWFGAGLAAACVNPLGPRLLTFPLAVLEKRSVFAEVAEWRSPAFASSSQGLFTLACLAGIVLVLVTRRGRRRGWADDLPAVAFLAAGLAAQRNLPMAAIVVAPVLARTFGKRDDAIAYSRFPNVGIAAVLAAMAMTFVAVAWTQPPFDLEGYPVAAAQLVPRGTKLVTTDVAAGYLILQRGRQANVFIDDRVDMYPTAITNDYLRLLHGHPSSLAILDRYHADYVLWETQRPLHAILAASDHWRRVGERNGWVVYQRR